MKYFIFTLRWSQTDSDKCIVQAHNEEEARAKIKGNARYVECNGHADKIIC